MASKINRTFHQDLILNQWILSLFNQENLAQFKQRLSGDRFEGIDSDGQTLFFKEMQSSLFYSDLIPEADLCRYDLNIARYWQQITAERNIKENKILKMKYFQYLSLLFTEIYLDWYFNKKAELISVLNQQRLIHFEADENAPEFSPYTEENLNKLAFWNATGSGKTLLMHVNILQYLHYCKKDRLPIYLLTPNEGLSQQHYIDLELSGFSAGIFNKNTAFGDIQILEISKLAEKESVQKVAVSCFAGDKLVLVDEGHRGAKGTEWLNLREQMIDVGFAFEYSATFGQALAKEVTFAKKRNRFEVKKPIEKSIYAIYAKSVLFDYSYKFFYADGYGKEHRIFNLKEFTAQTERKYFVACVLTFYQQLYLFARGGEKLMPFNLEKPLWVFVGNTVSGSDKQETSDILHVLQLLAFFLDPENQAQILLWLNELLSDQASLLDTKGNSIFLNQFVPLQDFKGKERSLFEDILQKVFNAKVAKRLQLANLKKSGGELALQVGDQPYFAVINIGNDAGFFKLAENQKVFDSQNDDYGEGLFAQINQPSSKINLLIGSRKFTEGWSSWRVSTMGLLNMGKSEGSQIIQLFGRGVRLKGRDFSLQRTAKNDRSSRGLFLDKLETLNIFGIRANYMQQFKDYLSEEGITTNDDLITLDFPTYKPFPHSAKLKTLRLKDGYRAYQKNGFKQKMPLNLYDVPEKYRGKIKPIQIKHDLYPRVEALTSQKMTKTFVDQREFHNLNAQLFPLFDWDNIYLSLQQYKAENRLFNLRLNKAQLRQFVEQHQDWYQLYIPASELALTNFAAVEKQQAILIELLKKYTEKFYQAMQNAYEGEHLEAVDLTEQDGSIIDNYVFNIEPTDEGDEVFKRLEHLKQLVEKTSNVQALNGYFVHNALITLSLEQHLYNPLFVFNKEMGELPFTLTPLLINDESEIHFVQDLIEAEKSGNLYQWIGDKQLFLMRNAAHKSKGVGFALAGNFYPDFLLWLVDKSGKQWLTFVDPKGLRHLSIDDEKLQLSSEIKVLEQKINQPNFVLNTFILAITQKSDWLESKYYTEEELSEKHILFMENDDYLAQLFEGILEG
ncbi:MULTISPECIES: DEAD/DEAH box helicase family protein [Rodentibacter]|uniref:DEAD/DEAH box helicase family protein n=1 Tax=Rodentibacter TaxID=1960084 RepID=UPI001CFCA941|nr:DEAD/DEAH box helicase family protein [Rodentibacter sp. JRC1]GJI56923.1 type III restriction endonuclease subunit R [Rodentibacter sp. JRC1]